MIREKKKNNHKNEDQSSYKIQILINKIEKKNSK